MTAAEWNAAHPVGTPVLAYPSVRPEHPAAVQYRGAVAAGRTGRSEKDPCKRLVTRTRTPAWDLGHGTPVVSVEGYAGGIALTHVDVAEESTPPVCPVCQHPGCCCSCFGKTPTPHPHDARR